MKFKHTLMAFGVAGTLGTALTGAPAPARAEAIVKVDGSSTVFTITEAVAEEFQKSKKGAVRVTVGISGTGGGFKKFCRGETDLSDASRPILKVEMEACKKAGIEYFELPVAYDAITVMVNPKNDWIKELTVEVVDGNVIDRRQIPALFGATHVQSHSSRSIFSSTSQ